MPIIDTSLTDMSSCDPQIYNGLDSLGDFEVWQELSKNLQGSDKIASAEHIYAYERAMQGPVMNMQLNGIHVNPLAREDGIFIIKKRLEFISNAIDEFAQAIGLNIPVKSSVASHTKPKFINPASSIQLQHLFYDVLNITPIIKHKNGKATFPMDDDTLEKLDDYLIARPFTNAIREYRSQVKQLEVFETGIDNDFRMRASFSIAGTETWRFSSSKSIIGNGRNLQNIAPDLRYIFEADEGFNLYAIDLEQAESREVGLLTGVLFDDWRYLDSCEGSDLHTTVASMTWPDLPWNHEKKHDRKIADELFHGAFTRRNTCKRLGHGCLTEDHEVLTPSGWVSITAKPDIIMEFTLTGDRFAKVSHWEDKLWQGEFYELYGKRISQKVTALHRIYYANAHGKVTFTTPDKLPSSAKIPVSFTAGKINYTSIFYARLKKTIENLRVICPTVPSGAFYIRRDGKQSVTGNSNYYGKPTTMSRETKIPKDLVEDFQMNYFAAFPAIPKWHEYVKNKLQSQQRLTNVFGVTRYFFDRPNEDSTLRAAIAFQPQSATALRLNLGMLRLWLGYPEVKLLLQVHDAVYFEVSDKLDPREVRDKALKLIEIIQDISGRKFTIPGECKYGKNWGYQVTEDDILLALDKNDPPLNLNLNGLRKIED